MFAFKQEWQMKWCLWFDQIMSYTTGTGLSLQYLGPVEADREPPSPQGCAQVSILWNLPSPKPLYLLGKTSVLQMPSPAFLVPGAVPHQ